MDADKRRSADADRVGDFARTSGIRPTERNAPAIPALADTSQAWVSRGSARSFQRDVYFYWSTVRAHPFSLTKQERLYKRDLRAVNAALLQPEPIDQENEPDLPRLLFLRLLLTDLGLLHQADQVVQAAEHPPFLSQKPTQRILLSFTRWRDGTFWNEALSIPDVTLINVQSRLDPVPAQISRARMRVLENMAELHRLGEKERGGAGEGWLPIATLIDRVREFDYDFLLPRGYTPQSSYYRAFHSYIRQASPYISYGNEMGWTFSPAFAREHEGWDVVEAGFIKAVLLEPLHWMGLVDIGYLEEWPVAYRLTPIGAWALGVGPEVDIQEGEGRVVVQPNFELFALDPISDLTLAQLDEFAERITAERAIKYRLTRNSVYRAQKNGWDVSRIMSTLRALIRSEPDGPDPLPQNVVRTLEQWQSLHERITIHRRVSLLQAVDDALLDQLMRDPAVSAHVSTRIAPQGTTGAQAAEGIAPGHRAATALIPSTLGEAEELVRALEEAGYPPLRTRSPRDAARPAITITEDDEEPRLTVHFDVALPSIYLFQQITPFARRASSDLLAAHDERGDRGDTDERPPIAYGPDYRYHITPETVSAAIEEGIGVDQILDRLRSLHKGPLPSYVERKIRAWGHYYGDATIQTITLVQVRDQKTLNDLLAEPEIGAILRPYVPDTGHALALADGEELDRLIEILTELGMAIKDHLD